MSTDAQQDAREQARHNASVMIAFAEGKEIQYRYDEVDWSDCETPCFNWDECDYRVKPEERKPREIYILINTDGSDAVVFRPFKFDDKPETMLPGYEIAKFREVLPETETE